MEPIVSECRPTQGQAHLPNPAEGHHHINFMTTAGFKNTSEYTRFLNMIKGAAGLDGTFVFSSDWKMGVWYGGWYTIDEMKKKKKDLAPSTFNQNYGSKWVGSAEGALVNYNQICKIRTLDKAFLYYPMDDSDHEFYAALDVARSEKSSNNQSALSIGEVIRDSRGRLLKCKLRYLTLIPNTWATSKQAGFTKKICTNFKIKALVVDGNGLGAGLVDSLCEESIFNGEVFEPWDVLNEARPNVPKGAKKLIWNMKAGSGNNPDVITNFINCVDSGFLEILPETKEDDWSTVNEENLMTDFIPKKETEEFVSEVFNLRLVINGKSIKIEQIDPKVNKDRYSSVAYLLWYIKENAETIEKRVAIEIGGNIKDALLGKNSSKNSYSPFGNRTQRTAFNGGRRRLFK